MNKYGFPSVPLPEKELDLAYEDIKRELYAVKTIKLNRTLTTFEAINGLLQYPFIDSMDMTTSPGFPFVNKGLTGEKRVLFDGEPGNYTPRPELQYHIDVIEARLKEGILPDYPFIDTLKDERKPNEDVAGGKVRMFSMNNVALSLVMRKLFLPTVAELYQTRNKTFLSVGINKFSAEWHLLVQRLLEVSDEFYDADYKKFDTRAELRTRLKMNNLFIRDYFSEVEKKMAYTALTFDSQALHQFLNYLVLIPSGTSSGSILTAIIGSLINEAYIRVSWQIIMPTQLRDLRYYHEHVRTKNYGDDLVITVSRKVSHLFNDKSIADYLAFHEITMTPGSKTGEWGAKKVTEFTFLKNRTRKFLGRWVPLAQDPLEQINWIRIGLKAEDPETACEFNCNSALRQLFFYGEEEFNINRAKILSVRPSYRLITYYPLLKEFTEFGQIIDVEGASAFGSCRMDATSMISYYNSEELVPTGLSIITEPQSSNPRMITINPHSGTIDEAASVEVENSGVTLSEQITPQVITRVENRTVVNDKRAQAYNNDLAWSLSTMLSRWNLVDTITWPATAAVGTNLKSYDILTDILNNNISSTPFTLFEKFRCTKISMRIECIGYRFCRGRIIVYFRPTMLPKEQVNNLTPNLRTVMTLPHVVLDPSSTASDVADLEIPYVFNKQYMDLVNGDSLGQLTVVPLNQFTPGTSGLSEATIKIFVTVQDAVFKQPRPGASTFAEKVGFLREWGPVDLEHRQQRSVPVTITPHSGIAGVIDAGASAVKELVKDINPVNVIGDLLGGLLDRVQLGENYTPIANKEMQYLSNFRNVDYTEYLSGDPSSQQLADPEMFSTRVNEMMIDSIIKQKPGFIKTVLWSSTAAIGDVLFSENVGPMAEFPISNAPGTPVTVLPLDLIASNFAYWRGGIVYLFEFVSTPFHEGKADVNFHPTLSKETTDPYTARNSVTQYTLAHFMRNAGNLIAVCCPYLGDTPVKKVWSGQKIVDTYSPTGAEHRFADYFSGSISLRVATALSAPATVAPDVEINVYKMAGDDFGLFMNTLTGASLQITDIVAHSGNTPEPTGKDRNKPLYQMPTTMLAAGEGYSSDVANSQFGENFKSLRDMCKRYQTFHKSVEPIDFGALTSDQVKGATPITIQYGISNFTYVIDAGSQQNNITKLARMYRLFRGPLCFKVRTRLFATAKVAGTFPIQCDARVFITPRESNPLQDVTAETSLFFPSMSSTDIHNRQSIPWAYSSNQQTAEFKVPYLSNRTTALVRSPNDNYNAYLEENTLNQALYFAIYFEGIPIAETVRNLYDFNLSIEILIAFGDETTFGVWLGLPECYIATDDNVAIGPDEWAFTPPPLPDKATESKRLLSGASNKRK